MLKKLGLLLALWICFGAILVLAFFFVLPQYGAPQLKSYLEENVSRMVAGRLQIGQLQFTKMWPLTVKFSKVKLESPVLLVKHEVEDITLAFRPADLNLKQKIMALELNLVHSQSKTEFNLEHLRTAVTMASTQVPQQSSRPPPIKIEPRLKLILQQAEMTVHKPGPQSLQKVEVRLQNLDLGYDPRSPRNVLRLKSHIKADHPLAAFWLPVDFSGDFSHSETEVSATRLDLTVANIRVLGEGRSTFKPAVHNWNFNVSIPQIESLPVPPQFLPAGKWKGGMQGHVKYVTLSGRTKPKLEALLKLEKLVGDVNWRHQDLTVKGGVNLDAFAQVELVDQLTAPKLSLDFNLTNAQILKEKLLKKEAGTPLTLKFEGYLSDQRLVVRQFATQFAQVLAQGEGYISLDSKKLSDFTLQVPPVELQGLEKMILPLSTYPVTGRVEMKGRIKGILELPEQLEIDVAPLRLQNIKAALVYQDAVRGLHLKGPVDLNANGQFKMQGKVLNQAVLDARLDLSAMEIQYGGLFKKPAGDQLQIQLKGKQLSASSLDLEMLKLTTKPLGVLIQGKVSHPAQPELQLRGVFKPILFESLSQMLPVLAPYSLKGEAQAQLSLTGKYDFKLGIQQSPLSAQGSLKAVLPKFVWKAPPPANANPSAAPPAAAEPLLPNWPLFKTSTFDTTVAVEDLTYQDLNLRKLKVSALYQRGQLKSNFSTQVFEGDVKGQMRVDDLTSLGSLSAGQMQVSAIQIEPALLWVSPSMKDLAKGKTSTEMQFQMSFPPFPDPLKKIRTQGELRIDKGVFEIQKLIGELSQKLEKIPGLGAKPATPKGPLEAVLRTRFDFKDARVQLKRLNLITSQLDEIQADGWLDLNKNTEMAGFIFLKNPPIRGAVLEANQDAQGRLRIPFEVTGNLLQPSLSYAENTISEMLQRTAENEKKKLVSSVKSKAKAEVDKKKKEAEKLVKDELQKKLKGILGQ